MFLKKKANKFPIKVIYNKRITYSYNVKNVAQGEKERKTGCATNFIYCHTIEKRFLFFTSDPCGRSSVPPFD